MTQPEPKSERSRGDVLDTRHEVSQLSNKKATPGKLLTGVATKSGSTRERRWRQTGRESMQGHSAQELNSRRGTDWLKLGALQCQGQGHCYSSEVAVKIELVEK